LHPVSYAIDPKRILSPTPSTRSTPCRLPHRPGTVPSPAP